MDCFLQTTVRLSKQERQIKDVALCVLGFLKKSRATVTLHCIGDRKIQTLNRRYRGKDTVTDVLSFPIGEGKFFLIESDKSEDWGDVFISIPQIKRQAGELGVPYRQELFRMTIHGILHLFGFDHERKKDAEKMFPLQERLVRLCLKKVRV